MDLNQGFLKLAESSDFIGGVRSLAYDHETVMSLAQRFADEPYFYLLESAASGPGQVARYSIMGFDPLLKISSTDEGVKVIRGSETVLTQDDPFAVIQTLLKQIKVNHLFFDDSDRGDAHDVENFAGLTGYYSYDAAQFVEPSIGEMPPKKLGLPHAFYFFSRNMVVFDHFFRRLYLVHYIDVGSRSSENSVSSLIRGLDQIEAKLMQPPSLRMLRISKEPLDFERPTAAVTKSVFLERVERCMEHIRAGDIFQIQIGNRLSLKVLSQPFDIFRHLRILNPSPYMFYFVHDGHHLIGASPEMMVNVEKSKVVHRPIAGTRKRSWNTEKDRAICEELQNDDKERAEHIMLVDLSRNDIGRIAQPGTVEVEDLMIVEKYSHVFHMVSQVSGKLSDNLDAVDAMKFSFPNGTVSGAPKVKAMQLINEIEDISREFYAGSLGVFSFSGDLKSTLMIRTIHYKDGVASTQASAGIVYDSIPDHEWQETRNKMAACLTAMQNTLPTT